MELPYLPTWMAYVCGKCTYSKYPIHGSYGYYIDFSRIWVVRHTISPSQDPQISDCSLMPTAPKPALHWRRVDRKVYGTEPMFWVHQNPDEQHLTCGTWPYSYLANNCTSFSIHVRYGTHIYQYTQTSALHHQNVLSPVARYHSLAFPLRVSSQMVPWKNNK